jgi:hypothetical protein
MKTYQATKHFATGYALDYVLPFKILNSAIQHQTALNCPLIQQ